MMDCQQALALLQDILDKEASEVDEQQVRLHLEKCRDCFEKFRLEESVQAFLNEKAIVLKSDSDSSPRLESLRANILSKLDEIDEDNHGTSKSFFNTPIRIVLSVAALIVLVGIGMISANYFRHRDLYVPIEQAHLTVADHLNDYTNPADPEFLAEQIDAEYHYAINPGEIGYTIIGGKKEEIKNVEWQHIVYGKDDDYISVFITDGDYTIPKDLEVSKTTVGDLVVYDHNCRGCRLIFYKAGNLTIITASANKSIDLLKFLPGHLAA